MTSPTNPPERKTVFAWASIAGADAEPVEIIEAEGRKGVLTLGCGDPFWLDDEAAGILVYANDLVRPKHIETDEQRAAREAKYEADKRKREEDYRTYQRGKPAGHSWRGPR